MVRPALLIALLMILTACGGSQQAPEAVSLAGTWEVELTRGVLPWAKTTVRGQVNLAPWPDPACNPASFAGEADAPRCETSVKGTYSIDLHALVSAPRSVLWEPGVAAMAFTNGKMVMVIGGCCDRGEIVASGRVEAARIKGGWYQQFQSDGPGGRFVLRRIGF